MRIVTPLDVYRRLAPATGRWESSPPTPRDSPASRRYCWRPIPPWICWGPVRCRWCWPWRRGCRRRSWWNATVWRRWQRGLPTAGWRRWCWAARTSYFKEALAARTRLPLVDLGGGDARLLTIESGPWFSTVRSDLAWERSPTAPGAPPAGSTGSAGFARSAAAVQGRGAAVKAPLQAHLDGHHQQHQHDQHQPGCKG